MVGWHHDGHGFGWTPGVGDGQGGLACCGSWGHKELDTTKWLNWTELYICKFSVYVLLKPSWKDFEHNLTSMWDEHNCPAVWTIFGTDLFGTGMKTDLFQSCGHCWIFQICWHIKCSTLTASSFRISNSSAGTQSPPLTLFVVMLPKTHLTSHYRISSSSEWLHHHGCLGH